MYADDTNLFVYGTSREAATRKANELLRAVNDFMKSNLLHINLAKCCYMYFEPPSCYRNRTRGTCARTRHYVRKRDLPKIKINGHVIEEVSETKFLGVLIDNKLSWIPHINNLHKKLKSVNGILNRIKRNIPKENYKSLYYALFESHMTYCITVFGGVSNTHTDKLFRVQKHCIRILFGDFDAYIQKSETCARARVYGKQILGAEFHCKEHTKPLLKALQMLAFQNLYNYQLCVESLKILKYRLPASLFGLLTLSHRNKGTILILPDHLECFAFKVSKMWNIVSKILMKTDSLVTIKVGAFKRKLKACLLSVQNKHDDEEWYPCNFNLSTALKQ